jgi:mannose-6-phosphate isomerase-like protein (cupin superfamily)
MISSRDQQGQETVARLYKTHDHHIIPQGDWHKVRNPYAEPCHIIEIQYGHDCREDDIELCPVDQEQRRLEYEKNNTI